jgi:hypothetical protein
VKNVKTIYKNCEIEITRKKCLAGYHLTYYNIFTNNGFEITSSFTEGEDTIEEVLKWCKNIVNDYIENPQEYGD